LALVASLALAPHASDAFGQTTTTAPAETAQQKNSQAIGTPAPSKDQPADQAKKKAKTKNGNATSTTRGAGGGANKATDKKPAPSQQVPKIAAKDAPTAPPPAPQTPTQPSETEILQGNLARLRSTTSALIELLLQQGIITREKAEELMRQAELGPLRSIEVAPADRSKTPPVTAPPAPAAATGAATPAGETPAPAAAAGAQPGEKKVVRVPYVPEVVKNEIRDQVREDVLAQAKAERWGEPGALPEWLDRISFDGDLRFRFQANLYPPGNTPVLTYNAITGSQLTNTTEDENRFLVRARFGINGVVSDPLLARISITTGTGLNPVSLNQNWANYNSGFAVQITDAYLRYTPAEWAVGWLGQFPKPFVSTEMLYWDDLEFDGIAATLRRQLGRTTTGFATLGAFLIQNTQSTATAPNPKTKAMYGLQLGGIFKPAPATRLNFAAAYYYFSNIEGVPNPSPGSQINDWTAPLFRQKGNSVFNINYISNPTSILYGLAPEYQILDLNGSIELAHFDPYLVKIGGDYVRNVGYNQGEILSRTGVNIEPQTMGWQVSLQVGKAEIKKLNDWQAFFIYRHLERDAVVDAFNDPDFYLGGTNYQGYTLGLRYGLGVNTWLRARWMSADQISGPPLAIDVFQLDLNAKF